MVIGIVPLVASAIVCQYRICIKNDVYDQGIDSDIYSNIKNTIYNSKQRYPRSGIIVRI